MDLGLVVKCLRVISIEKYQLSGKCELAAIPFLLADHTRGEIKDHLLRGFGDIQDLATS